MAKALFLVSIDSGLFLPYESSAATTRSGKKKPLSKLFWNTTTEPLNKEVNDTEKATCAKVTNTASKITVRAQQKRVSE